MYIMPVKHKPFKIGRSKQKLRVFALNLEEIGLLEDIQNLHDVMRDRTNELYDKLKGGIAKRLAGMDIPWGRSKKSAYEDDPEMEFVDGQIVIRWWESSKVRTNRSIINPRLHKKTKKRSK